MLILENYVFLDIEASHLDRDKSYPIQVGWARPTLPLERDAFLIRPEMNWTYWSSESQDIHGFSRQQCIDDGIPAREAAERINAKLGGRRVFVDAIEHDGFWLARLFAAAGIEPSFELEEENHAFKDAILSVGGDLNAAIRQFARIEDWAQLAYPHTHKADEDALQRAAIMRAIVDPVMRTDMEARHKAEVARRYPGYANREGRLG